MCVVSVLNGRLGARRQVGATITTLGGLFGGHGDLVDVGGHRGELGD